MSISFTPKFYQDVTNFTRNLSAESELEESLKKTLKSRKIVVLTTGVNGMGDYLCGMKICLYLHEKLGIKLENLALATNANENEKKLFSSRGIHLIKDDYKSREVFGATLQVIAPVVDRGYVSSKVSLQGTPTLVCVEYGFNRPQDLDRYTNVHAYALGIGAKSMGILLDSELLKFAASEREAEPKERLKNLQFVPVILQEALLGREYSQERIEEFALGSKLYFGYAHRESEVLSFIQAVATMNHSLEDKSDLCFYFMGDEFNSPREWEDIQVIQELQSQGVGKLCYKNMDDPKRNEEMNLGEGKTLKIITGKLNSAHVNYLHQASEKETLATGDQSFTEALSAGKLPAYEMYEHKRKFYMQFANELPQELKQKIGYYTSNLGWGNLADKLDAALLAQFYIERRKNPEIMELEKQAIKNIVDRYDFGPRFNQALSRLLEEVKVQPAQAAEEVSLPEADEITSEDIPYDAKVLLNLKDIGKLKISTTSWVSALPQFQDSTFKYFKVDSEYFVIIRKKNTVEN